MEGFHHQNCRFPVKFPFNQSNDNELGMTHALIISDYGIPAALRPYKFPLERFAATCRAIRVAALRIRWRAVWRLNALRLPTTSSYHPSSLVKFSLESYQFSLESYHFLISCVVFHHYCNLIEIRSCIFFGSVWDV